MTYAKVLTDVPAELTAGDSVSWKKSLSDFPAPTWVITYALVKHGTSPITITGSDSGTSHLVEVAAATTAAYKTGDYAWQEYVTNSSTSERYKTSEGSIKVLPNYATAASKKLDTRTHNEIVLENIQAVIQKRASSSQLSYSIAGRSLSNHSLSELVEFENVYLQKVAAEKRRQKRKQGKRTGARIKVRFS